MYKIILIHSDGRTIERMVHLTGEDAQNISSKIKAMMKALDKKTF